MKAKNVLIGVGLFFGVMVAIGYRRAKQLQAVLEAMQIKVTKLSNFKPQFLELSFDLDITLTNPTGIDFSVSSKSVAVLKQIKVYRKGHYIGTATLNMVTIEIPAQSSIVIEKVPFRVATASVLKNLITIEGFSIDQLSIEATVDVLGYEYIIQG